MENYKLILEEYLSRRKAINPSYSLRAFSKHLNMPASKLSEVLNNKRGISLEKAMEIAHILKLKESEKNTFLLSVKALHSRSQKDKKKAFHELEIHLKDQRRKKSTQLNAWYFGAVEKLSNKYNLANEKMANLLGIKKLQIENAKRYLKRMKKNYPERKDISFDNTSIIKKISDEFFKKGQDLDVETEFLYLSEKDLSNLKQNYYRKKRDSEGGDLYMISMISVKLEGGN